MRDYYLLEVSLEDLLMASDMLRYDGAFEVSCRLPPPRPGEVFQPGVTMCEVSATSFTPDRWRSFGVSPRLKISLRLGDREWEKKAERGLGFTDGLRFCQRYAKERVRFGPLVEG